MEITEEELLSDDGIFAARFNTVYDNLEKCCLCGYEIKPGEKAMEIHCNGDLIHKECWQEYAEDNIESFGKEFTFDDDGGIYTVM